MQLSLPRNKGHGVTSEEEGQSLTHSYIFLHTFFLSLIDTKRVGAPLLPLCLNKLLEFIILGQTDFLDFQHNVHGFLFLLLICNEHT